MSSNPPLVSIVSPSFNQGRYIEDAIRSVLAQDYPRLEYVVMDGGSTDETLPVVRRWMDGHAGRMRFISKPDAGQAAAINEGFRMTSGEVLAWLNADDIYEPGAVTAAVATFRRQPRAALVYGGATFVDAGGQVIGPCEYVRPFDRRLMLAWGDVVAQPAAFFSRRSFEAIGGLDESLRWTLDYDLWLKLSQVGPVVHLPDRLARYRWTGENKTARGGLDRLAEIERVARRHGGSGLPAAFRIERAKAWLHEARGRGSRRGWSRLPAIAWAFRDAAASLPALAHVRWPSRHGVVSARSRFS